MSDKLGPIAYGENEESVFLGRDMTSRREDYSEETAREIDQEVRQHRRRAVRRGAQGARATTATSSTRSAHALLERETLDSTEIEVVLAGRELPVRQRLIIPTWAEKRGKERAEKKRRPASSALRSPRRAESALRRGAARARARSGHRDRRRLRSAHRSPLGSRSRFRADAGLFGASIARSSGCPAPGRAGPRSVPDRRRCSERLQR